MTAIDTSLEYAIGTPAAPRARRKLIDPDSLTHDIIYSWFFMRRAVRRLIVRGPAEATLFRILMLSNMAFLFSWTVKLLLVPQTQGVEVLPLEVGALAILAFYGRTAVMYVLSMVLGALCRVLGGRGTWRNTRIAVFWGALVAAPFGVAAALVSVALAHLAVDYPIFAAHWIATAPYWLGVLPFMWFISVGLAQAHGFRRNGRVFLYMSLAGLAALLFAIYFQATVLI
ncbi:MAG: hypothetical protein JJU40_14855 [Rhodobacteraceae bacterium]|nr:hypothetical protein [Paracoccaceae bacterium]